MPTYTSTDTVNKTSDGYVWKYMLSLNTNDRQRFLSSGYFPVRTLALNDGSLQWQVQKNAIPGGIWVINMTCGGNNYTNVSNLVVTVTGDGSGCQATGSINLISNIVSNITVSAPGGLYHFANVAITGGGGDGTATANAVISPFNGHGSDPARELGASSVMINISLNETEGGYLAIQEQYRQIGLIENPLVYGTSNTISNSVFPQVLGVQLSTGYGNYLLDEYVFQGPSLQGSSFSGQVVNWDSTNNIIALTQTSGSLGSGALVGLTTGISRFVISSTPPGVTPFSGSVIYYNNTIPIQRAINQAESLTVVLGF